MSKIGGRLKFLYNHWVKITDDRFILESILGYKIPFFKEVVDNRKSNNFDKKFNCDEIREVKLAIDALVEKGAVIRCEETQGQFLSPYFLVKKPNGTFRFILNLKYVNKFILKQHFKLEDLRTVTELIFPDYF